MKQLGQSYRTGDIAIEEVGYPALRPGGVIVRTAFSVVSVGTEGTKVREARMSLLEKASARPDQVKQVLDTVRQQGLRAAYQKVMNRLEQLTPLGYSLSGYVTEVSAGVTEFSVGQKVAAAGANLANHAEYNFVPRNLVVPVPEAVPLDQAAFTTIGAVAMHAYRQSEAVLGEVALVVGLGLVGQVLIRILVAAGVRVVGVDLSADRVRIAMDVPIDAAGHPDQPSWREKLSRLTGGLGADVVLITAGTNDRSALELATSAVRDRGRIVVVGKTKLNLDYNEFFKKEIEVRFSRSYGPGRYDPRYENEGCDYPYSYVRWTERRNLEAFLGLIASKQINLTPLVNVVRSFEDAEAVYNLVHDGNLPGIGVLFDYGVSGPGEGTPSRVIVRELSSVRDPQKVSLGVIGAGNYASSMLLPHLAGDQRVAIDALVTTTGLTAASAAKRFGARLHGTDRSVIMNNPEIDAVVVATRHRSHAHLTAEALRAGKAVFVEKPLAIDAVGLAFVTDAVNETGNTRLHVGFNRRFSPIIREIVLAFKDIRPLQMIYRVHAGALAAQAWQRDAAEGGRFIGEAGHFMDVFAFITGSSPVRVSGATLNPTGRNDDDIDNVACVVAYADGSVGTLVYVTQGGPKIGKEYLEVHGGGQSVVMSNFARLEYYGPGMKSYAKGGYKGDKGQAAQMRAFTDAVVSGGSLPIPYTEIVETTRLTLLAREATRTGQCLDLGHPVVPSQPKL
jgi:predicted dehydrogenase/threonine dehydrogenase-like Zn-dependent dehydrogenase